jgi:hypothetical protein
MLTLFVPTRGRVDKQVTREAFALDHLGYDTVYVVPKCEYHHWRDQGVAISVVPDHYRFSDIRQHILEYEQLDNDYHCVLDDDLLPSVRLSQTKLLNLRTLPLPEKLGRVRALFGTVSHALVNGWVHGGVSAREGNNREPAEFRHAQREMRLHFYNAGVVRELGYDFRRVVTKQDFDFTLWMLRQGIPNLVIYRYAQDQRGSNVSGGCSSYRTQQVMEQGARALAELHPGFVKVVEKETKGAWGGGKRVDVNVRWLKAYDHGKQQPHPVYGFLPPFPA